MILNYCKLFERYEVLTEMKIQAVVFLVVTPCGDVKWYQRFGTPCSLHIQGCWHPRRPSLESYSHWSIVLVFSI